MPFVCKLEHMAAVECCFRQRKGEPNERIEEVVPARLTVLHRSLFGDSSFIARRRVLTPGRLAKLNRAASPVHQRWIAGGSKLGEPFAIRPSRMANLARHRAQGLEQRGALGEQRIPRAGGSGEQVHAIWALRL